MSEVVRYRPVRVSVRLLREALDANGPASVANLTAVARAHDGRVTEDLVREKLTAHPNVFNEMDGGTFTLVRQKDRVVVRRTTRPRPQRPLRERVVKVPRDDVRPPAPPDQRWSEPAGQVPVVE